MPASNLELRQTLVPLLAALKIDKKIAEIDATSQVRVIDPDGGAADFDITDATQVSNYRAALLVKRATYVAAIKTAVATYDT